MAAFLFAFLRSVLMVKENGRLFVSSVLAGMCITLGGKAFLRLKDAFKGGKVVGYMLFTVGLFV